MASGCDERKAQIICITSAGEKEMDKDEHEYEYEYDTQWCVLTSCTFEPPSFSHLGG